MANVGTENKALWPAILEKAFAKLHGTYENIISGDSAHSIEVLTGAHTISYEHNNALNSCSGSMCLNAEQIFDIIKANTHVEDSDPYNMISAGTEGSNN